MPGVPRLDDPLPRPRLHPHELGGAGLLPTLRHEAADEDAVRREGATDGVALNAGSPGRAPAMRLVLDFFVDGSPITQGSKRGFVVNDKRTGKPRAVVTEERTVALGDWRRSLSSSAALAMDRADFTGYVALPLVELDFGLTKPATVKRRYPTVKPDVDKLARAVLDALTAAGVYKDDAAVVDLLARKRYSARPGVRVRVYELEW